MKIAIIGTGISAATLAQLLGPHFNLHFFEKDSEVGGRLKRFANQEFHFDLGAQDFAIQDEKTQNFLAPFIHKQSIIPWEPKAYIQENSHKEKMQWNDIRYTTNGPMENLVKALLNDATIQLNAEISFIKENNKKLTLIDKQKREFPGFDWVISTIPAPLQRNLIPQIEQLKQINYTPRALLLQGFEYEQELPEVMLAIKGPINWIIKNHMKPGIFSKCAIVAQSRTQLDFKDPNRLEKLLTQQFKALFPKIDNPSFKHCYIWPQAHVTTPLNQHFIVNQHAKIACCGDGFGDNNGVEGAILSAIYLSEFLIDHLR